MRSFVEKFSLKIQINPMASSRSIIYQLSSRAFANIHLVIKLHQRCLATAVFALPLITTVEAYELNFCPRASYFCDVKKFMTHGWVFFDKIADGTNYGEQHSNKVSIGLTRFVL